MERYIRFLILLYLKLLLFFCFFLFIFDYYVILLLYVILILLNVFARFFYLITLHLKLVRFKIKKCSKSIWSTLNTFQFFFRVFNFFFVNLINAIRIIYKTTHLQLLKNCKSWINKATRTLIWIVLLKT